MYLFVARKVKVAEAHDLGYIQLPSERITVSHSRFAIFKCNALLLVLGVKQGFNLGVFATLKRRRRNSEETLFLANINARYHYILIIF